MDLHQHTLTWIVLPSLRYKIGEKINPLTVNNYSSFYYVKTLQEVLGDPLFSRLRSTFLGPIIQAALHPLGGAIKGKGLGFSGKIVHFLLSRQIMTTRKDELWFCFSGQPMRFSLREFHLVTGLPCWETDEEDNFSGPFIDTMVPRHNCEDLLAWIINLPEEAEECKLRLVMLLIMESIFFIRYSNASYLFKNDYLELARDEMMTYPWGKIGFKVLMDSVQKIASSNPPTKHYEVKGFPMALQLWLLASVPKLEKEFARLDNNHVDKFICAKYSRTSQPMYEELEAIEQSVGLSEEVTCILSSCFDEATKLFVHEDGDELGTVVPLVKRGYWVTASDWNRNFIELEIAEECISQKNMRFHVQEDVSEEMHEDDDVGDDINVSDENMHLQVVAQNNILCCRLSELEEEVLSFRLQNATREISTQSYFMHPSGDNSSSGLALSDPVSTGVMAGAFQTDLRVQTVKPTQVTGGTGTDGSDSEGTQNGEETSKEREAADGEKGDCAEKPAALPAVQRRTVRQTKAPEKWSPSLSGVRKQRKNPKGKKRA